MAAFKLPKNTPNQQTKRAAAIQSATLLAAQVPLAVMQKSVSVMALAERAVALGNPNAISDGATAATMAHAALTSAGYNVRININGLDDKTAGDSLLSQLQALEERAMKLEKDVHKTLTERGGISTP
jgi:glutamate formiminotransferase/formiminotetrahydrofolate cyclodeaminase